MDARGIESFCMSEIHRTTEQNTSDLGVCPDCNGPFNGEFMHKPKECKRQVMEWLSKIASKLDEEDASKVLLSGHTIGRLAAERDRLQQRLSLRETALRLIAAGPPITMANDGVAAWAAFVAQEGLSS